MNKPNKFDDNIVRSGARIRESVRSLPKGHFQQIKQMFDKPLNSTKKLSTIYERQQKPVPSHVLLGLPVTDDEKLQHTKMNDKKSLEEHYRDYLAEYQEFRLKLTNEFQQHKTMFPSKQSLENHLTKETLSYTPSLPQEFQLTMSSALNYTDSYDSPHTNRTVNSRPSLPIHAEPVLVTTSNYYDTLQPSRRLHSSTSLSSTGYDSNSSPSIKSKRNSITTTNSNDFPIHSTYSSSSSSDEQQLSKSWIPNKINPSFHTSIYNDDVFESSNESSPLISRTQIQLIQPTIEPRPVPIVRHAIIRNSTVNDLSGKKPTNNSSFIVQTTSFPEHKIHRWNNISTEIDTTHRTRKYPLSSTSSTGFQVMRSINEQQSQFTPTIEQKQIHHREESPLPLVENPIFHQVPPKKPPRTFEHENKFTDQKVPSSSSSSSSPVFDLGTRSVSCMDLTAGVSNALLSSGLLPLEHEHKRLPRGSSIVAKENIYEELKTPRSTLPKDDTQQFLFNSSQTEIKKSDKTDVILRTTKTKANPVKSVMKKGTSEPNLAKTSRSKSPFSPRGLFDRFKRILPTSLSKQSLNEKTTTTTQQNDSDDSGSTSSENNDNLRTSRLDHVSRVKNVYDSLSTSNHMSSLFIDPNIRTSTNELTSLYDYVVHILPEQEFGYFSNGNGCLSSSNFNSQQSPTSTSIRFKYPSNANDEVTLKYFCFPDQHDSNNNPLILTKKPNQEYFRFTLTNMHGIRQYGYCSRFVHKSLLNALCIVSPYDMIEIYEKILSTATELFLSYKDDDARKFLEEIYVHRLPNRGDTIHIHTATVGLYTLKCEYDRRKELIDSVSLLSLSTDTIIKIFSSILYEQKLIFIGNDLGPLTRLINTFICLLYPFSWPHTYVPILPALMLDIIQAPTPYIIGILRSCESYLSTNDELTSQDNSDILIIDIDHDRVRSLNDYLPGGSYRSSMENLHNLPISYPESTRFQILPKIFKIELKQEISLLRKTKLSLSLDECQQRLRDVFMSIFVQSCYNYKDFFIKNFHRENFVQSKQHTIELFLEWFTRTQIFELFIRQKFECSNSKQFAITFDIACEKYARTLQKQTPQRITAKSVKRKSATRTNKQENRF